MDTPVGCQARPCTPTALNIDQEEGDVLPITLKHEDGIRLRDYGLRRSTNRPKEPYPKLCVTLLIVYIILGVAGAVFHLYDVLSHCLEHENCLPKGTTAVPTDCVQTNNVTGYSPQQPRQRRDTLSTLQHNAHISLLDNVWYNEMTMTGRKKTNDSCYVCSHIPHAAGADRLIFPREAPPRIAKCLLHLFLCRVRGQVQVTTVNITKAEVDTTVWDHTPVVHHIITDRDQMDKEIKKKKMNDRGMGNISTRIAFMREIGFISITVPSAGCNFSRPHLCKSRPVLKF